MTDKKVAAMTKDSRPDACAVFLWRKHPVLEKIRQAIEDDSCGTLCSLRFTWSRPKRRASGEDRFLYVTFAAMLDGAQLLADAEFHSLHVEKVPGINNLFALARFRNGVVAEFELNECLPDTMPDICFLKGNFTDGHISNQPLVGYFNEEGMVFATDDALEFPIAELASLPVVNGPVEQLQQRFDEAVKQQMLTGPDNSAELRRMIREAVR